MCRWERHLSGHQFIGATLTRTVPLIAGIGSKRLAPGGHRNRGDPRGPYAGCQVNWLRPDQTMPRLKRGGIFFSSERGTIYTLQRMTDCDLIRGKPTGLAIAKHCRSFYDRKRQLGRRKLSDSGSFQHLYSLARPLLPIKHPPQAQGVHRHAYFLHHESEPALPPPRSDD